MTTVDVLSNLRQELARCALRREKLLRSLFGVSVAFVSLKDEPDGDAYSAETRERELTAFLDSNDITHNRPFDVSTLPSPQKAHLSEHGRARTTDSRQSIPRLPANADAYTTKRRRLESPVHHATSLPAAPSGEQPPLDTVPIQTGGGLGSKPIASSNASDAGSTGQAATIVEHSKQAGPPALSAARDSQGSTSRTPHSREGSITEALNENAQRQEAARNLTPPDSGRSIHVAKVQEAIDRVEDPKDKVTSTVTYEADTGAAVKEVASDEVPSTSHPPNPPIATDSKNPPVVTNLDLPSQFIQDAYDDGNGMMDIPPLNEDTSPKDDVAQPSEKEPAKSSKFHGMRDHVDAGVTGESSSDLTLSRRPPMRIDTSVNVASQGPNTAQLKSTATLIETATPGKITPSASTAQSPPERMTTRVSSGALRHKSVSEILGETPRSTSTSAEKFADSHKENHPSVPKSASSLASPDRGAFRLGLSELRDKERSKLSTVVFAKQQSSINSRVSEHRAGHQSVDDEPAKEPRDYFLTYFAAQASAHPRALPLQKLLQQANKILETTDHYVEIREKQDFHILHAIKGMQQNAKWSLRQPQRSVEPQRSAVHWDVLLGQMKWMRTDFREERKFKLASAKYLADSCAAWVASPPEERHSLQVQVRRAPLQDAPKSAPATPDLVHDQASEATEDSLPIMDPTQGDPPAAIFSLPPDVFVFGLNATPVAEKILMELPFYEPSKTIQDCARGATDFDPDGDWKTDLVPVSKFAHGKLAADHEGPPRKKSRLAYSALSTSPHIHPQDTPPNLAPLEEDVALFNPEHKHIRDRIHAGHAFKPPSDHQMPTKDFFECRMPSQWTTGEEDELRRLVREYSYNWSLISSCMSFPSVFTSGAERRTPWECFEQWIQLEGLPVEMQKVPYFRTYSQRLQQGQRAYEARQLALVQQQGGNPAQLPPRRRSNQPCLVEKRKNNRPIHLIDAMRKSAKKRELHSHKQQQGKLRVASVSAMRKATEQPKERKATITAREYSRLKWEKQAKAEEQALKMRAEYLRQMSAKKAPFQPAGPQANGVPTNRAMPPGVPNGASPNVVSAVPQYRGGAVDVTRTAPTAQRPATGQLNGVLPTNGQHIPHAPMQPQVQMSMGTRGPPPMTADARVVHEAQRVQAEQQAYLHQQRQQQRHPQQAGPGGSPQTQNLNPAPQNGSAMLASMQGRSSPSVNGVQPTQGTNSSPRGMPTQPQSLSSGMTPAVNQIQNQVKLRHPSASPNTIQRLTTEQLYRMSQQQQQSIQQTAMAAAVGNSAGNMGGLQMSNAMMQQQTMMANGNAGAFNQQQYANYMRNQQASQQRSGSAGNGSAPNMNGSRSVTPQVQRTGSAQGGALPRAPTQSPRPGPVGLAGGQ